MRRYVKYLIITSATIILLTSFSLFYFNDSLLVGSMGHLPAHLRAGRRQNFGHSSVKISKKTDKEMQSRKHFSIDYAYREIVGPQAVNMNHHSNRSVSMNPVIKPDRKTSRSRKDALLRKDRNSVSMNGNKVLNSSMNGSDNIAIGRALSHNINASPHLVMNGGQSIGRHVKGNQLNRLSNTNLARDTRQPRGVPPHSSQQQTEQNSRWCSNYVLSSLCSDPLCTNFLSERDLGNFTACRRRAQAVYSKKRAKTQKTQEASSVNRPTSRFSECRFMNGSGRSPVGLVSFPGSGNTWVRGLLQKATGICTGRGCSYRTFSKNSDLLIIWYPLPND